MMRARWTLMAGALTLAASASTLQAHHSGVMFDDKKEVTLRSEEHTSELQSH